MGASPDKVFMLKPGSIVEYWNGQARKAGHIPVKNVLVDGLGIGDVGNVVLRDRRVLAKDGIAIVLIEIDAINEKLVNRPEIISRGFVFQGQEYKFLEDAASKLQKELFKKKRLEKRTARDLVINFLEKYFYKETKRRPMVLPVIVEV
jgi:ribonuclease J